MAAELIVAIVVIPLDGGILDCAVHPFHLAIGPGVFDLGQAVVDPMLLADSVKDVLERACILLSVGELNTVVGQDGVDLIGNCDD